MKPLQLPALTAEQVDAVARLYRTTIMCSCARVPTWYCWPPSSIWACGFQREALPRLRGEPGRPRHEHRRLLEGILWVMTSGHAWRDLPARFGPWHTAYHRLRQWRHEGLWDGICRIPPSP